MCEEARLFGFKRLDKEFDTIREAEYTSAKSLAKLHGVTSRTIRSDISKINRLLEGHGARIAIKREKGYHLVISDAEAFKRFREHMDECTDDAPDLTSANDRIRFLLRSLLYATDYLSYEELADLVYVVDNTLQNYLRQIREALGAYELALITRPGAGVKIVGREADRRRCFIDTVVVRNMRGYVTGFSADERALFPHVDLGALYRICRDHFERSEVVSNDYGFKNLMVHAALMVERVKAHCEVELTEEIEMTPRIECLIDATCSDFETAFDVVLPRPERRYLYLHLISNATLNEPDINTHLIGNDIDEMLELVYRNYGFDLREDAELKSNLMQHLLSTFRGKNLNLNRKNPLLNTIRSNFPLAFEIALASTMRIFNTEPNVLNEDEVGYVALHIGAAMERQSPKGQTKLNVLLVCSSAKSIAEMLRSRIETFFGDKLEIIDTITYRRFTELSPTALADIAFMVSTVPLDECPVPYALVDFSLNTQDTETISRLFNAIRTDRAPKIAKFFAPELFERFSGPLSKGTVLERLCKLLEDARVVDSDFLGSVIDREGIADTSMGPTFAIPHSMKPMGLKTKVAVALLDRPAAWSKGVQGVRIVFLLAVRPGDRENLEHLYDLLLDIANNRHMQQRILDARDFEAFMAALDQRDE